MDQAAIPTGAALGADADVVEANRARISRTIRASMSISTALARTVARKSDIGTSPLVPFTSERAGLR
jgi:hypothetical protein